MSCLLPSASISSSSPVGGGQLIGFLELDAIGVSDADLEDSVTDLILRHVGHYMVEYCGYFPGIASVYCAIAVAQYHSCFPDGRTWTCVNTKDGTTSIAHPAVCVIYLQSQSCAVLVHVRGNLFA